MREDIFGFLKDFSRVFAFGLKGIFKDMIYAFRGLTEEEEMKLYRQKEAEAQISLVDTKTQMAMNCG